MQDKKLLLICAFGGLIGLHHFYIGDVKKGILYLFTGGLFGIGWVLDIVKIIKGDFKTAEDVKKDQIESTKWKQLSSNFYISEEYQKLRVNKQEIDFTSIIDVDLIEDETSESITKGTNTTEGKAKKHIAPVKGAIGGMVFGPAGAIIGATSGKTDIKTKTTVNTVTKNVDYCTKLALKITLNDINNPMVNYTFINMKTNKNSFTYKNSHQNAQKCISALQVIINNNKQTLA